MDENTRSHCLEPFFTTKGVRGTGLGLAMVYGIAQRHRAQLQVDSETGKGTTIRLLFSDALGRRSRRRSWIASRRCRHCGSCWSMTTR